MAMDISITVLVVNFTAAHFINATTDHSTPTGNLSSTTKHTPHSASWTLMPVYSLIVSVFGFVCNLTALVAFLRDRTLHTSSNIHIMNLLLVNVISTLTQRPLALLTSLYGGQWFLGPRACDFYLYCNSLLGAAVLNTHGLIALNRAWAIVHPSSYRIRSTKRLTLLVYFVLWIYLALQAMPAILQPSLDGKYAGCHYNNEGMEVYNIFIDVAVYIIPVMVVWLSFIVVSVHKVDPQPIPQSTHRCRLLRGDQ
ncbi:putative Melanopsin [Hypsibius exemplaris]|uniref:Melanopsin n=1 Tax=Hypsibius exemplaris TaxID=2072580 RepID=A0A1W0WZ33_HYPEX|nr:putative Melanopsin [Hypsibius exemplaris]